MAKTISIHHVPLIYFCSVSKSLKLWKILPNSLLVFSRDFESNSRRVLGKQNLSTNLLDVLFLGSEKH